MEGTMRCDLRNVLSLAGIALCLLLLPAGASAFPVSPGSYFSPSTITHQVFQYVDWKYVDPDRAHPEDLLRGAFKTLETRYPEVLVDWDEGATSVSVTVDAEEKTFATPAKLTHSAAAATLEGVLTFVSPRIQDDIDADMVRYTTLNGALSELDPHTNVFAKKHYKDFKVRTSGSFGGIGFTFGIHEGDLTIISPIPDTPASRAGLQSGDRILFIDGDPTMNMSTDVAVGRMRGEPGTPVTLTIGREGWQAPRDFPIIREIIHIVTVEEFLLRGDGETPVLYLKVRNFQEDTADELRKALGEHNAADYAGVIIDLRNNPGGLLQQAIEISDGFLEKGVIVSTRGRDGKKYSHYASASDRPLTEKPLVLLINRGSASASEIVAGALQGSRGLVLGKTSFGKGSVQQAYPLMDGGGLLLTISQYLTPGDVSIQSIGITPDLDLNPVQISAGNMRYTAAAHHSGEADLKNAFTDWGNATRKERSRIRFLRESQDKDAQDRFTSPSPEERQEALATEFEVRLARKILGSVAAESEGTQRDRLLAAADHVLQSMVTDEQQVIGQAFSEAGVNWTPPTGAGTSSPLSVTFPKDFAVTAGSTGNLTLSVKNEGEEPVYRVWGNTDSDNVLLKDLDFAFGYIAPGEERSWSAEIEVPKSADTRWDTVTLRLKTNGTLEAGSYSGSADTRAMPLPAFAYTCTIVDENPDDPSRNDDGILEEGERARLTLSVSNQGLAASDKIEINLHADEKQSFYLDEVRRKFESLAPGETRDTTLSFRLLEAADDGEVEVRITISDREHGRVFADTLKLKTGTPYTRRHVRFPPRFTLAQAPPVRTDSETVTLKLTVTDDEAVKEFYAYRGDKKISYLRNREGGTAFPVEIKIPLESGSNRISLFARDRNNIVSQQVIHIHRTDDGTALSGVIPAPQDFPETDSP
jgi:carboxyl-terminal processing protease